MMGNSTFPDEVYFKILFNSLTATASLSVVANIILIFVILRYKKLREDSTNFIFLFYNIFQIVLLLAATLVPLIFYDYFTDDYVLVCTLVQIDFSAFLNILAVLILLIWDSFFKIYHNNKYKCCGCVSKFFIVVICIVTIGALFFTVPLCFSNQYLLIFIAFILTGVTGIFTLFVIIMNIVHAIKKRRLTNYKSSNIGLVTANIFCLLVCPTVGLYSWLLFHGETVTIIGGILLVLVFSNPIINLLYVYFFDTDYNVALKQSFCCKEYENVNLEDQSVTYNNDANGVLISNQNHP